MTTKAIILCAGTGERMRNMFPGTPKCLVPLVNGITPLEWSLSGLTGFPFLEIVIVTGYQSESIESFVQNNFPQASISFMHNEHYLQTDAAYSFCMAAGNDESSSSLLLYGDALYDPRVFRRLMEQADENAVAVDNAKPYTSMDMKVAVNADHRLIKINKQLTASETYAESICLYKIGREMKMDLLASYTKGVRWFEDLLEQVVQQGKRSVGVLPVATSHWAEIDRPEDIPHAKKFLAQQLSFASLEINV